MVKLTNTRTGFILRPALVICIAILFIARTNVNAQVISNNGAAISLTNGVVVNTDTVANNVGSITNNGTIILTGDYRNAATTSGNGFFNLAGDWINTGIFTPGASTVQLNGSAIQTITGPGSETFNNLIINNSGASPINRIVLSNNVTVSNALTLNLGNVDAGANKLFLSNQAAASLNYTSLTGSRIIGKFERGINSTSNYLFPIGSADNYNPLNLKPNSSPAAGSILSEFINTDPGNLGLPLVDAGTPLPADSIEVDSAYNDGYWSLTSNGFSCANYNINLDAAGFIPPIQNVTRIIKRPSGGDWSLDGTHSNANGTVTYRNNLTGNILGSGNDFAVGHISPRIRIQPKDIDVCDGTSAWFSVVATGLIPLTYQWQEFRGSGGWNNLSDGGIYTGTKTDTLILYPTDLSMNGYRYRVIVTDANGNFKISNSSAILTVNPNPVATATPQTDTLCNNSTTYVLLTSDVLNTTFTIEVLRSGNILGASTILTGGNTIQQILNNPTNVYDYVDYRIIPTGPFSTYCEGTADTVRIYVNPTPQAVAIVFRDTICNDTYSRITLKSPSVFTSGEVTFDYTSVATGGVTGNSSGTMLTNQYVFEDSLHNPTGLPGPPATPQTVTYTIRPNIEALSCSDGPVVTAIVTVHPTPDTYFDYSNYQTEDSVTCYLDSDGFATIEAQNGVNLFTYFWDDPANQTDSIATGLAMGTYTVTITDNQGCTTSDTIEIKQPDRLTPVMVEKDQVSCFGLHDAHIIMSQTGGNGGYTYWWEDEDIYTPSPLSTDSAIVDINGGFYFVTITDYRNCTIDTTILVYEPGQISLPSYDMDNVTCYGMNNGYIKFTTVGPTDTIIWVDDGFVGTQRYNLAPGNYSVILKSTSECDASGSIEITEPPLLESETESTSIYCAGDANGTAKVIANGGNEGVYSYQWTTGATSDSVSGLSGGEYYVTVSDVRGCSVVDTAIINEPPSFWSTITHTDVTCYGSQDGTIELISEGGNGTHSYLWSNNETTSNISDLGPGIYTVTITDERNCEINNSDTILEPGELVSVINKTDISCYGNADGTAKVIISGGNGGYSVLWSNNDVNDSIFNLSKGNYSVNIEDIKGCTTSNSIEISEPEKIMVNEQKINITCFGFNNGVISLLPTGGILPYTYTWSHNATLTDSYASSLEPGTYTISVTDNNNCLETVELEITQPDPLIANITKEDITCFGFHDGYISIDMYGGTPAYTYQWENGIFEPSASLLGEGDYSIHIFDAQNCNIDTTVQIIEPEQLAINPEIVRSSCPDIQDGIVVLNISGGVGYYDILWSNGLTVDSTNSIRSGRYEINIQDENLCELKTLLVVPSGTDFCITIPNAFTPNNDGVNDLWSIFDLEELYPNADIEVFDRRGVRVFYSKGYKESQFWDGTFNGKELPMDSYYYIIYLKNGLSRISGTVTILR